MPLIIFLQSSWAWYKASDDINASCIKAQAHLIPTYMGGFRWNSTAFYTRYSLKHRRKETEVIGTKEWLSSYGLCSGLVLLTHMACSGSHCWWHSVGSSQKEAQELWCMLERRHKGGRDAPSHELCHLKPCLCMSAAAQGSTATHSKLRAGVRLEAMLIRKHAPRSSPLPKTSGPPIKL